MKSTKFISKCLLIFLLVLMSCEKDDGPRGGQQQENIPDTFSEYFGNDISRDFLGNVIDKNHNPIEGVAITIGNEIATTDSNGVFIIRDANVNDRFGYVKAEKAGYIHGSRSVVPSEGTNKVTIMLLEATVIGSVNSGSPETITTNDGSSVSFDGDFIKEDGSIYSGSIDVIMHHLDPTDENINEQMPGMLYAQNEDGAERMLQTLGMLAVELRGSGGEELNLAEGSTSEIKIPVDASLMNIAPTTIPLWYFDEDNGYWKEEGQATLQGNMYVGTVSHFSFWNCDIPAEAITLCVTVSDEDGNLLNNMKVGITSVTYGTTYGYTNENGQICGYVPTNGVLILNLYSYDICGDSPIYEDLIGPFSIDYDIAVIVPEDPDIIEETIVGTFNNCDGDLITEGYVQINYGGTTFTDLVNNDGSFEIIVLRCFEDNTFSILGTDLNNLQSTGEINYTFTSPITDIQEISACNTIDEYIIYTIDDGAVEQIFSEQPLNSLLIQGGTMHNINNLDLSQLPWDDQFELRIPTQTGSYFTDESTNGILLKIRFLENGNYYIYDLDTLEENNITINVTYIGENVGDYIDVNFSGEIFLNNGSIRTISGLVHVKKD